MSELTPEERQRIYEEEKARLEIRKELDPPKKTGLTEREIGCMWVGGVIVVILLALLFFSRSD